MVSRKGLALTAAERDVQGCERVLRRQTATGRTAVRGWDCGCEVLGGWLWPWPGSLAIACYYEVIREMIQQRAARKAVVPAATAWRARPAHCSAPGRTQAATRLSPSTCLIPSCLLCFTPLRCCSLYKLRRQPGVVLPGQQRLIQCLRSVFDVILALLVRLYG